MIAALAAFFIALFGILLFSVVTSLLDAYGLTFTMVSLYSVNLAFQCVFFLLPTAVYYRRHPGMLPALRWRRVDPLCAVWTLLAAVVGAYALNGVSVLWMELLTWLGLTVQDGTELIPQSSRQLYWLLVISAVVPAIVEEFLYRGLLLPAMEPMGVGKAVLISGMMFALIHRRVEALPAHLLMGCAISLLTLQTGSLPMAMLYHAVHNASIVINGYAATQTAASIAVTALTGYLSGPLATVLLLLVWLLLLHLAMRRGRQRRRHPLSPARKQKLSRVAFGMLVVSVAALMYLTLDAVWGMLPERML